MPIQKRATSERIAQARGMFEAGTAVAEIARAVGVHDATVRRWCKRDGWRIQRDAEGPSPPALSADEAGDTLRLIRSLRRAVSSEIAAIGALPSREGDGEPRARTLANLARTLTVLRGLEAQFLSEKDPTSHDAAADGPVDIAELRRELARRLARLGEAGADS